MKALTCQVLIFVCTRCVDASSGDLGEYAAMPDEEGTDYACTNKACKWRSYRRNVDWGYYSETNGDCAWCQQQCNNDPRCWAVECDDGYCSWWANGKCLPIDADMTSTTCRSTDNVEEHINEGHHATHHAEKVAAPDTHSNIAPSSGSHVGHGSNDGHGCDGGHGSASGEHGSSSGHGGVHFHDHEVLVGLFAAVLFGAAVLHLSTHPWFHSLQFTVVLFVFGCFCGLIIEGSHADDSYIIIRSYHQWVAIDPHLLLFTFLPPLLAGDAMTIDTHVARRCAGQCMILAGPGVVIGAFATAFVLWSLLPWEWDFMTSLTVGSILAATDPVAVVGLLKELGAPQQLTIMIQGESLLNDGIAIVLFTIAYEIVGGEIYGPGKIFVALLKSSLGASFVGVAIGIGFYMWIFKASDRLDHSSPIIQICLTLACAYWSFIFAEGVLHISGVLSTVCASLVLAHKMWPVLVDRRSMLEIWHVIETVGNTLVFFLAGVLTGKAMLAIPVSDYIWVLVVYIAITIIRLVMLLLFLPVLNYTGGRVTTKDVAIMTWGGLRGMVGLALAILVKKDGANGNISDIDGDRILFLIGSIAALTLVVNATTCPALTNKLEITMAPEGRNVLIRNVERVAREHVYKLMWEDMQDDRSSKSYLPGVVRDLMNDLVHNVQHHLPGNHDNHDDHGGPGDHGHDAGCERRSGSKSSSHSHSSATQTVQQIGATLFAKMFQERTYAPDPEQLMMDFGKWKNRMLAAAGKRGRITPFQFGKELPAIQTILKTMSIDVKQIKIVREVFLEAVRASYWEQLERGRFVVGSPEPQMLLNSVNLAKESCVTHLSDWVMLQGDIVFEMQQAQEVKSQRDEGIEPKSPGTPANPFNGILKTPSFSMKRAASVQSTGLGNSCDGSGSQNSNERKSGSPLSVDAWKQWAYFKRIEKNMKQQTRAIQVITAFIEAHQKAQTQIAAYFGDDAEVDSPEEAFVIIESQVQVFKASAMACSIDRNIHLKVNTIWKAHHLADEYRKYVENVAESGVLQGKEAETLLHPIADTLRGWEKKRRQIFKDVSMGNKETMSEIEAILLVQRCWKKMKESIKSSSDRGSSAPPSPQNILGSKSPGKDVSQTNATELSTCWSAVNGSNTDDHQCPEITAQFDTTVKKVADPVEHSEVPVEFSQVEAHQLQVLSTRNSKASDENQGEVIQKVEDGLPKKDEGALMQKVEKMSEMLGRIEKLSAVPVLPSGASPREMNLDKKVDDISGMLQRIEQQKKEISDQVEIFRRQQLQDITRCQKDLSMQLEEAKRQQAKAFSEQRQKEIVAQNQKHAEDMQAAKARYQKEVVEQYQKELVEQRRAAKAEKETYQREFAEQLKAAKEQQKKELSEELSQQYRKAFEQRQLQQVQLAASVPERTKQAPELSMALQNNAPKETFAGCEMPGNTIAPSSASMVAPSLDVVLVEPGSELPGSVASPRIESAIFPSVAQDFQGLTGVQQGHALVPAPDRNPHAGGQASDMIQQQSSAQSLRGRPVQPNVASTQIVCQYDGPPRYCYDPATNNYRPYAVLPSADNRQSASPQHSAEQLNYGAPHAQNQQMRVVGMRHPMATSGARNQRVRQYDYPPQQFTTHVPPGMMLVPANAARARDLYVVDQPHSHQGLPREVVVPEDDWAHRELQALSTVNPEYMEWYPQANQINSNFLE